MADQNDAVRGDNFRDSGTTPAVKQTVRAQNAKASLTTTEPRDDMGAPAGTKVTAGDSSAHDQSARNSASAPYKKATDLYGITTAGMSKTVGDCAPMHLGYPDYLIADASEKTTVNGIDLYDTTGGAQAHNSPGQPGFKNVAAAKKKIPALKNVK